MQAKGGQEANEIEPGKVRRKMDANTRDRVLDLAGL